MNKLFSFILFFSVYGMCSCFTENVPNLLKDTTIDCNHLVVLYQAEECPGFSIQEHNWVEARKKNCYERMSCVNLGKIDSVPPIEPDSVKLNSKKKQFLYKNGVVYETNEMIRGQRYNEKFIFDTTIHDTTYQIKMKSFFLNDSLVKRNIMIDTIAPPKKRLQKK